MAQIATLKQRTSTKPLVAYPEDVQSDKANHYVRFDINIPSASEINFGSRKAYATEPKGSASQFNTISVPRAATKQVDQSIVLYMPANLEVSHKANYGEPEIGLMAAASLGALKGFNGGGFDVSGILEKGKAEINNAGLGILEGLGASGVKAAVNGAGFKIEAPYKGAPTSKKAAAAVERASTPKAAKAKAAPKAAAAAEGDDLTKLTGVGPAAAQKLNDAGITTFAQVAAIDLETFEVKIGEKAIAQAAELAK